MAARKREGWRKAVEAMTQKWAKAPGRRKMVESSNIKLKFSLCIIEHMEKEPSGQLHPLRRVSSIHCIRSWAFLRWFGHFRDKKHFCFLWESNPNS
jgi:hypothetical protein